MILIRVSEFKYNIIVLPVLPCLSVFFLKFKKKNLLDHPRNFISQDLQNNVKDNLTLKDLKKGVRKFAYVSY